MLSGYFSTVFRLTFNPTIKILYAVIEVMQKHLYYGRNKIKDLTYPVQFLGPGVFNVARQTIPFQGLNQSRPLWGRMFTQNVRMLPFVDRH